MPHAAPGENARGAVRRKLPEYLEVPVQIMNRRQCKYPIRLGMEISLHRQESGSKKCSNFTQSSSYFGVEPGRLGEVVSLVGDCRPPPPGNPHRLTIHDRMMRGSGWGCIDSKHAYQGGHGISVKMQSLGGFISLVWKCVSFNKTTTILNLKDLNSIEYFKKDRSYFSCIGYNPVLKFVSFHYHLCGFKVVEPPSIAITNVLET